MPEEKKDPVTQASSGKCYPAPADKDGFYYASRDEEISGILTKDYENGSAVKKVTLSNGSVAVVRKLRGRDFIETKKSIQSDSTMDFETVNMSQATEIDGKRQPPEYFLDNLFQSDYAKVMVTYGSLNF